MQDMFDRIWASLLANWQITLLVVTWLGILFAWWRRRRDRRRKRYVQQVNFSLNYLENGVLKLRTLAEDSAAAVWLDDDAVSLVCKAAENTSGDQPFIRIPSGKDMAFVKRAIVNVLSERFAPVYLGHALGSPVAKGRFVFGVTFERYGPRRTQKLRVIIARPDDLAAMFSDDRPEIAFDNGTHHDRLRTLESMWKLLQSKRDRDRRVLGEVELGVTIAGPTAVVTTPTAVEASVPPAITAIPASIAATTGPSESADAVAESEADAIRAMSGNDVPLIEVDPMRDERALARDDADD